MSSFMTRYVRLHPVYDVLLDFCLSSLRNFLIMCIEQDLIRPSIHFIYADPIVNSHDQIPAGQNTVRTVLVLSHDMIIKVS